MNFWQKHAIITGASSGIGKETAKLLASLGANVSIIARHQDRLAVALAEIETRRVHAEQKFQALVADVADNGQIEQAIRLAISQISPPDILITSAGIVLPDYFQKTPLEVFEKTMAINYFGSLYAVKAVIEAMEAQKKGQIVLISSGAGLIGVYGYTSYSPSKFALRGLAESLRGELKPLGIGVSIVYPPDTDTPMLVEENKTKPPETKRITATASTMSAAEVAAAIVKGIEKNSFAIAPGLEMTLLTRLHSLLSPLLNWYFDHLVTSSQSSQ